MHRSLLFAAAALLGALASLRSEEDPPRWNITAECQMVTLPQKLALALLPELSDDAKIEAGFASGCSAPSKCRTRRTGWNSSSSTSPSVK